MFLLSDVKFHEISAGSIKFTDGTFRQNYVPQKICSAIDTKRSASAHFLGSSAQISALARSKRLNTSGSQALIRSISGSHQALASAHTLDFRKSSSAHFLSSSARLSVLASSKRLNTSGSQALIRSISGSHQALEIKKNP